MPSLAETQALFRRAVAGGSADAVMPLIMAPADPTERLDIYRRHYRESFRRHLRGRYPTLEWLVGTDAMVGFADALLRQHPPRSPSLADYGEELAEIVSATRDRMPPWLTDIARLDWHLGRISVATEAPSLAIGALAALDPDALMEASLVLQPGLHHLQSDWPVDELVHLNLKGGAPDTLRFEPMPVCLELRGGRGRFAIERLAPAEYVLRRALAQGRRIGIAAERALGTTHNFDLPGALVRLFASGLVTAISNVEETADD